MTVTAKERPIYTIKLKNRELVIDEKLLDVISRYVRTQMTLEELARELGLEGWEEAYELIKKMPAWLMWTSYTLWEVSE